MLLNLSLKEKTFTTLHDHQCSVVMAIDFKIHFLNLDLHIKLNITSSHF